MRYAIYGGSQALNRLIAQSLLRIRGNQAQVFDSGKALKEALRLSPHVDVLILTGSGRDASGPVLLGWLDSLPLQAKPRVLNWQSIPAYDGAPGQASLNNATLSALTAEITSASSVGPASAPLDRADRSLCRVFGRYEFPAGERHLRVDGQPVMLTDKLYALAWVLFQNLGQELLRESLYRRIWGDGIDFQSRTLDTHIATLRARLELRLGGEYVLRASYRRGYTLMNGRGDDASADEAQLGSTGDPA